MLEELHSLVAPYALAALNDKEERDFEEHLALCQRCREDLSGLREAAASLAYAAVGPAPPPELKQRILDRARSERPNVTSLPRRQRSWTAPLAAAAAIAASAAIGLGIWGATRSTPSDPLAAVLAQPGAKLVPMSARGALAVAPNGDAVLALAVPLAPSGKTYEAWVIRAGKARPAGLFRGRGGTSIVEIGRPVGSGAVVAVTLERVGGASHPTQKPFTQSGALT